jgi:hypothetical protein
LAAVGVTARTPLAAGIAVALELAAAHQDGDPDREQAAPVGRRAGVHSPGDHAVGTRRASTPYSAFS